MVPNCENCANYKHLQNGGAYEVMCTAPQLAEALDPLEPNLPQLLVRCNETRSFKGACGIMARWFVPRPYRLTED